MTATEIAAAVRSGEASALEVLDDHLRRIEARNPELNAIVVEDFERAREAAARPRPGPLCGVPFTVKEAIATAGLPACEASRLRPAETPEADAPAVARLREAGAILLGKTNISELCAHPDSTNVVYGATRNPVDPARSACGSSGGEGAAVGASLSAFGIGSDYGGSIRAPAHFCGVVGLRPGLGRVPTAGHLPHRQPPARAYWSTIGPLARSVADLELVLSVLADEPVEAGALPRRVAIYRDALDRTVDGCCSDAVDEAAARLPLDVVDATPPFQLEAERLYESLSAAESREILEGLGPLDDASPHLRSIWQLVRDAPPAVFDAAVVAELEARAFAWLEDHPILLCPPAATPAFALGYEEPEVFDLFHHCKLASALGLPAAVVPISTSPEGLPVGVQIVGRRGREDEVLAVARAVEGAPVTILAVRPGLHPRGYRVTARGMAAENPILERVDLNDQVYASLKEQIAARALTPGEKLSLQELADEFGVSRSPVQHALTRLVTEGLVVVKPRLGHFVKPLTATVVVEAYDVREALELQAAERTVGRLTPLQLAELRRLMERTLEMVDGTRLSDRRGYLATNQAFHDFQVELAGNALMLDTYRRLSVNVLMERILTGAPAGASDVGPEHVALVAAFDAGDLGEARAVIRRHVETGKRLALEGLSQAGGVL